MLRLLEGSSEFMKNIKKAVALIISMSLCLTGCGAKEQAAVETEEIDTNISTNTSIASEYDRETIYQVSLLQGLTFGDYNGSVSVADLKKRGDIGIGTFEGLNGELIAIDGKVYRAAGDGSVEEVSDDTLIPFSNVIILAFFSCGEKRNNSLNVIFISIHSIFKTFYYDYV
jgi:acetolactate decarboxylase